jgi:UDP-N-acetyl-D-glucosamine dehydrogenase
MASLSDNLARRIKERKAQIAVLGLGYVGLPLAVALAEAGYRVLGLEVDPNRRRQICKAKDEVLGVKAQRIQPLLANGRLQPTDRYSLLGKADVILICVPTPLKKTREPDLGYILAARDQIVRFLKPGQLVILESTTYPGTTDELFLPAFTATGLKLDREVFLAFSPERIDPGNSTWPLERIPKVVGGVTPTSTRLAALLYRQIVEKVVPVSSSRTAEMVKLLENTFRIVNIALANELALICHRLKIDVWEVIEAASTKPFGFMPFYPGPGIGGHCIPTDPLYLSWHVQAHGMESRLIDVASRLNQAMPDYVVERIADILNRHGQALWGAKLLLVGVAYKSGVSDVRDSPAVDVLLKLEEKKAHVCYHDPLVPKLRLGTKVLRSVPLTVGRLRWADGVVVTTDQVGVDYARMTRYARWIFDTRNALKGEKTTGAVVIKL